MRACGGNRGQSIQVGAVLLFGALVLAFSMYQAFVIPEQNETVEFNHNQKVQRQLQELRSAIVSMPGSASTQPVDVQLGTQYPARLVGINPGPPSGQLRTTGTNDGSIEITIENAQATGSDAELDDFWNGSAISYETGSIVYDPNYNVYKNAPTTIYENTLLFNQFRDGVVPISQQSMIRRGQITVLALDGKLATTGSGTATVDLQPASTSSGTILVTDDGSPITVTIPTRLTVSQWQSILQQQISRGVVTDVRSSSTDPAPSDPDLNGVVIELASGTEYELQAAKVGVGTGVSRTQNTYLTRESVDESNIEVGENTTVTVMVRDNFGNPVSGVTVERADGTTATTGSDGTATFTYEAPKSLPSSPKTEFVNLSIEDPPTFSPFDASTADNVSVEITVVDPSAGSGGGGAYDITWKDPSGQSGVTCSSSTECTWDAGGVGDTMDLTAVTSIAAKNLTVDFGVNKSGVLGDFTDQDKTDDQGEAVATLTSENNGDIKFYGVSGGSKATMTLHIKVFEPPVINDVSVEPTRTDWLADCADSNERKIVVDASDPDSAPSELEYVYDLKNDGDEELNSTEDNMEGANNEVYVCDTEPSTFDEEFTEAKIIVRDETNLEDSTVLSLSDSLFYDRTDNVTPGFTLTAALVAALIVALLRRRRD